MTQRFTRNMLLILWCCLLTSTGSALSSDHRAPIKIIADTVAMNYADNITTLQGNVTLTQGSTEIKGATVILYSDKQQRLVKLVANGDTVRQAQYSTLPEKDHALFIATANKIIYLSQDKLVNFIGDTHATDGHNHFQGPNFHYWTEKQAVITEKNPNQQATILIVLESSS